jgi:hypothetical protein
MQQRPQRLVDRHFADWQDLPNGQLLYRFPAPETSYLVRRGLGLVTMGDEPKYNSGRNRTSQEPLRFEDLDESTRNELTQAIISMVNARELAIETMQPVFETIRIALPPLQQYFSTLAPSLRATFETASRVADMLRRWVPNWPSDVDFDRAWEITGHGIPLAFVPREQLVTELVAAQDHDTRLRILLRSKREIIEDCRTALEPEWDAPFPESVEMLPPLLNEAIEVLDAGHVAAACTLGIAVIDSALHRTHRKKINYEKLRARAMRPKLEAAIDSNELRVELAWRPLHSLHEQWSPYKGIPLPPMASRHVVTHWADPVHLSEINAVIIVMVATSLFLGLA